MPVFITGLPLHVLVVHAVVVLVPLAVLASIVVAAWPAARRRYGWLAVGFALVATAIIPIATGSGEDLRDRLVPTDLIRQHAHLGDQLLMFVAVLFVLVTALVGFDHHRRRLAEKSSVEQSEPVPARGRKAVVVVLAVLTVGFGVTSAVQVVRIGDSGARAAWAQTQYVTPQPHHRNG